MGADEDIQPLRTIMNYQYRFGTSFPTASRTLYQDGGYGRYYQGIGAALIQGMISLLRLSHDTIPSHLSFYRSRLKIRRHSSKCRHSRFAAIKLLSQKSPFTRTNDLCFPVCCNVQNDTYANRYLEDDTSGTRSEWNGVVETED